MKKLLALTMSLLWLVVSFSVSIPDISAKTLGDLKKELSEAEQNYANKENEERMTQEEINANNQNIASIKSEMIQIEKDIENLEEEITRLNQEIKKKEKEIKSIVNFVQVSNGESAYLEYAFGAKDFTDFIYRMSISEQLANYNDRLVEEFTQNIEDSKKKQKELSDKTVELEGKQKELEAQQVALKDKMASLSDIKISIYDEIKLQREAISVLVKMGCKDHEDINNCGNQLPPGTMFYRPIIKGHTTSEYGWRCLDITGCELHSGLDMSVAGGGVPIYASAPGTVIGTIVRSSCGGNQVIVLHNINGKKYTTLYAHLRRIDVVKGQVVTMNTQIGIMGGNPTTEWWDKCSTGSHLHFTVATGHYLKDYYSWSTFMNNTINPRQVLNVPPRGVEFTNRNTKY